MNGRIHSFQSMGAVDGPGIRGVVFLQGCPLRCVYCHNPDTWAFDGGQEITSEQLTRQILRYRSYYKKGGVTVSGGEPLMQSQFVADLFKRLKKEGVHTALDTSGMAPDGAAELVLPYTDLVICDLKFISNELYSRYTGLSIEPVIRFLNAAEAARIPLWIRHVVVPGLTDSEEEVGMIAAWARKYSNLEKLELLPFRKLCLTKYNAMDIPFPLRDVPECTQERILELNRLINNI